MQSRLKGVHLVYAILALSSTMGLAQVTTPKNILFIAVDDLKPNMYCYGDTLAKTPSIDALASQGIIFNHAYCQQAVCAPSRASLMTSRYPDQTKVHDLETMMREVSPDITTLPEYLIGKGFLTSATGKIYDFRSVDDQMDAPSWSRPYQKYYDAKYYDPINGKPSYYYASPFSKDTISKLISQAIKLGLNVNEFVRENYYPAVESADVRYDGYVDGAILNAGIELMDEVAAQSKPFFLGIGFHRPHLPFVAPKIFWDLYERENFSLPAYQKKALNSPDIAYHNYEELRAYTDIPQSGSMTEEKQLELIHGYYAATSYIDFLIGKLLLHLDELGLRDNTLIVLWGDHGWHLGDHDLWCKHSNFEEATRVPLIFSYPGQENLGVVCDAPVEFTDIAPTLCDLLGVEIPVYFEGESLVPLFENPDTTLRYGALSQYPKWGGRMGYSLRSKHYRYTKWMNEDGKEDSRELYDYQTDPLESISLINNASYNDILEEMDSILSERIGIPSTQTRIDFRIMGLGVNGDTVKLSNSMVEFHTGKGVTNPDGRLVFTHMPGSYIYKTSSKGYTGQDGEIDISGDTTINIFLKQEQYTLNLEILEDWSSLPHENAQISFGEYSGISDEFGKIVIPGVVYDTYTFQVVYMDGKQQEFKNLEVYSDTTIQLKLTQPIFKLDIILNDYFSESSVSAATVRFDQFSKSTDYLGSTYFETIQGSYSLHLEKKFYETIEREVIVDKDMELLISMIPTHNDTKIWIKNGGSPLPGAIVQIDTLMLTTQGLGLAKFENLPIYKNYIYTVVKDGFELISGDFYLIRDTVITIEMKETALVLEQSRALKTWPNPVSDILYLELPDDDMNGTLHILGLDGRQFMEIAPVSSRTYAIDISSFYNGVFYMSYTTDLRIYKSIIIKTSQ